MHEALILIARAISFAHNRWRLTIGRRRPLSGRIGMLEERVQQREVESALLRTRLRRLPARRRPHYRRHERLEVLWHAARFGLSIATTAAAFAVAEQTILNWRRDVEKRSPHLVPPLRHLPDLVHELVFRLKAEWPRWGTRRIAGQLARLGVKASRTSVQRILRRPRPPGPEEQLVAHAASGLLPREPHHIWMIDFTRLGGVLHPLWVGAVVDAFSRKVLEIAVVRGAPSTAFSLRLLRGALRGHAAPTWLVTDNDPVLRSKLVNALLRRHGTRRRYGAVGRKGSIAIIERMWRSMKEEYARHLFLHHPVRSLEARFRRWARWHITERPHQGLGQRTPDDVHRGRRPRKARTLTAGTLHVRFLHGDQRLPVLRLRDAA